MRLPKIQMAKSLQDVLSQLPHCQVLSESEKAEMPLNKTTKEIVVGPEGGWSPKEMEMIGDRGVTLGPRILRTEHAGMAAAAAIIT
ncbi:RsmE family RNA methyltransferase, partial [Acinetobacter baumannii]